MRRWRCGRRRQRRRLRRHVSRHVHGLGLPHALGRARARIDAGDGASELCGIWPRLPFQQLCGRPGSQPRHRNGLDCLRALPELGRRGRLGCGLRSAAIDRLCHRRGGWLVAPRPRVCAGGARGATLRVRASWPATDRIGHSNLGQGRAGRGRQCRLRQRRRRPTVHGSRMGVALGMDSRPRPQ